MRGGGRARQIIEGRVERSRRRGRPMTSCIGGAEWSKKTAAALTGRAGGRAGRQAGRQAGQNGEVGSKREGANERISCGPDDDDNHMM